MRDALYRYLYFTILRKRSFAGEVSFSYNKHMRFYKDKVFWYVFTALALVKGAALAGVFYFHPLGEKILAFPDSLTYVYPAQTWLEYGQMWEAVTAAPMLLRTPGYPFFLAVVQTLFHNMTWAVVLVQHLLSLALLIPVYMTAEKLNGKHAARAAVLFCAASVLYFSLSFAVLTEILCAFLLSWFVYFTVNFLLKPAGHKLFLAALFLSSAVYVRPAAYYFMFASAIILVCFSAAKLVRFPAWKIAAFFFVPLLILVGAWQVRNSVQTGFGGFTSVGAYNLYMWNEDYLAHKYNLSVPQAHQLLENALPPGFNSLPPTEQVRLYKAMAKPLIQESFFYKLSRAPLWAVKTLFGANFVHCSRLLTGGAIPEEELDGQMLNHTTALHGNWLKTIPHKLLFLLTAGEVFLLVLCGSAGFLLLWKTHRTETFFLLVYCLYFWGIGSVFFGAYARFRAPFEFALCITAGAAANALVQYTKTKIK